MRPTGSDAGRDPWPWRLRALLIFGFVVAVVAGWASVSYFGRTAAVVESFTPADGWCDAPTQGLGIHCFGDFGFPRMLLDEPQIWGVGHNGHAPNPYTALGMVPHLIMKGIADTPLGVRGSLALYLIFLAVSLLVPAFWVIFGAARTLRTRDWLPLLLIGTATGPFLMTMDRGNSIGFAVPFLLLFCLFVRDDPKWVAPVAVIAASSIRPQFVLLAVALVAVRRWRAALSAALGALALNLVAFAVWPGGATQNIRGWLDDVASFQAGTDVAAESPINISAAHAVASVGAWLAHAPGAIGSVGQELQSLTREHAALPGVILIAAVVIVATAFRGRISLPIVLVAALALPALAQGLAYGYGLIFALVLAALILGQAGPGRIAGDGVVGAGLFAATDDSVGTRIWKWATLAVIVGSVVPFLVTSDPSSQSAVKAQMGLAWLVIVIAGLVLAVVHARGQKGSPSRPVVTHEHD